MNILNHEGRKYLRVITCSNGLPIQGEDVGAYPGLVVDVYDVIEAFGITCPARVHAVKKLLCAGSRGKGDTLEDLKGVLAAVHRAIELEEARVYLDFMEENQDEKLEEKESGQESKGQQVREESVRAPLKMVDPEPEGA